jgi:hypothetical protein
VSLSFGVLLSVLLSIVVFAQWCISFGGIKEGEKRLNKTVSRLVTESG